MTSRDKQPHTTHGLAGLADLAGLGHLKVGSGLPESDRTPSAARAADASSALVYSTDVGTTCPACRQAVSSCVCANAHAVLGDGNVRVMLEKRKGKVVTLVSGLALTAADLVTTGKALRQACGSGGTSKDGAIEVQGNHVPKCAQWLRTKGYNVVQPKP
jgi:translation initiation factor 1